MLKLIKLFFLNIFFSNFHQKKLNFTKSLFQSELLKEKKFTENYKTSKEKFKLSLEITVPVHIWSVVG